MIQPQEFGPEPGSFTFNYRKQDPESYFHHAHRGIELLYIYEGHGEIRVDNRIYPIENHSLVWFQPYQLHRVAVPPVPNRSYIRTILTFDPSFADRYLAPFPALERFFRLLQNGHLRRQCFPSLKDTPLAEQLREWHAAASRPSPHRDEELGFLLISLIRSLKAHVFADEALVEAVPSRARSHAERIAEWLDGRYKQPFRLEQLASGLHLSPYHISRVFKKATGMTPSEYLMRRRVREACILLGNTSLSIQEIASELGGLSASYFCEMFKKAKGVSPDQYRRSIR
ncbi:helix-turn-helix transcriptional regulator [Cohnella hongkongensis]|uniref:AraC family transcriptional regulator n=1 Tax=Cohnella hongkongensis TaxID=178337 RepID=A0ABV9FJD3_9BACL